MDEWSAKNDVVGCGDFHNHEVYHDILDILPLANLHRQTDYPLWYHCGSCESDYWVIDWFYIFLINLQLLESRPE